MKKLLIAVTLLFIVACNNKTETQEIENRESGTSTIDKNVSPASTTADDSAVAMLNSFYKEYVTAYSDTTATSVEKTKATIEKYCTPQLSKKIEETSLDSDPFINAQDGDMSILKTLIIKSTAAKNVYKACYTESYSNASNCTDVTVTKVGDTYKISHVVLIEL